MERVLHYIKILFVVGFIIVEELAWKKVGLPVYNSVASLKIMDRFKSWISEVENRATLVIIFLLPFVLMEISSIYALKLIATGAVFTGIGLYMFKLLLTIPVVIIFNSGKSILVKFWPIRFGFGSILKLKRSKTFRRVKQYTSKLKEEWTMFRHDFLDGDANFGDELKKMYEDIKKV